MKKILIVNKGLAIGGIEMALANMANALQEHYQVDLLVFDPTGPVKNRLNAQVTLLEPSWRLRVLGTPLKRVLRSKKPRFILFRVFATVWTKLFDNRLPVKMAIKHQPKLLGYDLAIAFHQEMRRHTVASGFTRVVDQCVEAGQKVAWLHYDSMALDLDSDFNNPFYEKMDRILCVSRSLRDRFVRRFPQFTDKTEYCYNFLNHQQLEEDSLQKQEAVCSPGKTVCFCACRLAPEKALVRAVICLAPLFRAHPEVMWFIAGEGPEREKIEAAIRKAGLQEQIRLLGNLSNPYPYMRQAALLLNVSYHEAAPMVFLEAKALGVPVFATKTASAQELLSDPDCGFLCENSEKGIFEGLAQVLEEPWRLRQKRENLKSYQASNASSLNRIRSWLENEKNDSVR